MTVPYIGITGIVTLDDVEIARECAALLPPGWRLMAGVLVSATTLRGEPTPSRRYPAVPVAAELLRVLHAFAWPVVHYNTRTMTDLSVELMVVRRRLPFAHGVQLNVAWPEPRDVSAFLRESPGVDVVLQARHVGNYGHAVYDFLASYPGARYALLDASRGTGQPLDVDWAASVLRGWPSHALPGVAGGLGPDCEEPLRRLRASAPGVVFSVDAESGLRVSVDDAIAGEKHQDRLDRVKALAYVRAALRALA